MNECVFLIDLDAFFVQVARNRDKSLLNQPFCIEQHGDIICVSYEAREFGVKKHQSIEEALKLCEKLKLIPIDTSYGSKISYAGYFESRF